MIPTITRIEDLPDQYTNFKGEWLEMAIPHFRTLSVLGRDTDEMDYTEVENVGDGGRYYSKRKSSKNINVRFYFEVSNFREIRGVMDKLKRYLTLDPGPIIFGDERDKYFVGHFIGLSKEGSGYHGDKYGVVGTLAFRCTDPHKYALTPKVVVPTYNAEEGQYEAVFTNEGTIGANINYEIKMNHDNGYIGISSNQGIMAYGNTDEKDTTPATASSVVFDYKSGTDIYNGMAKGQGIFSSSSGTSGYSLNGSFKTYTSDNYTWVMPNAWGSSSSTYHGAGGKIAIPKAADGTGPIDWQLSFIPWYEITANSQSGCVQVSVADINNNLLCNMHLTNINTTNMVGSLYLGLREDGARVVKKKITFTANASGKTNINCKPFIMKKMGDKVTFIFDGEEFTFDATSIKDSQVGSVSLFLGNYKTMAKNPHRLRCREITFTRLGAGTSGTDIPNRYALGSIVTINGSEGKFYVDGVPSMSDELRGTVYFKAEPGENKIIFSHSDFSIPAPDYKLSFREAWLS